MPEREASSHSHEPGERREAPMEPCHGCGTDERTQKRSPDTRALLPPHKAQRSVQRVVCCSSVCNAAEALLAADCLATFVKRPLTDRVVDAFSSYLASQPSWPDTDDLHPMEATYDRIAVIEFTHEGQTLEAAIGYGRNLPPRHSPQAASASAAIAQVLRVLPDDCAAAAARDASELLEALRHHTGWRQYIVRLELVRGDTCQRWRCSLLELSPWWRHSWLPWSPGVDSPGSWLRDLSRSGPNGRLRPMWGPAQVTGAAAFNTRHRDLNVCRTIVTYAGPGTHVAHEVSILHISTTTYFPCVLYLLTLFYVAHKDGVARGDDGSVDAADAQRAVQLAPQHGPSALARSTLWPPPAPEARPLARGRPLGPRGELAAWQPKRGCGGTLVPATRGQFHRLWQPRRPATCSS